VTPSAPDLLLAQNRTTSSTSKGIGIGGPGDPTYGQQVGSN
jgi:hypothetical protein